MGMVLLYPAHTLPIAILSCSRDGGHGHGNDDDYTRFYSLLGM